MNILEHARSRPVLAGSLAAAGLVVAIVLGWAFQPWQLFLDTEVDEDFPAADTGAADDSAAEDDAADDSAEPAPSGIAGDEAIPADEMLDDHEMVEDMPAGPTALVAGSFGPRSHPAMGSATIYELEDASQVLRLEDFETDNGPDLFVYLSAAPADAPAGDFDEDFIDLGRLKGNIGNQNYDVPDGVDLSRYTTVVIWCDRFDVAFGTASLS